MDAHRPHPPSIPQKHALDGTPYYFNTVSEALSWDKPASLRTEEERQETLVWVRDTGQGWAPAQLLEDDGSQVTVKLPKARASRSVASPLCRLAADRAGRAGEAHPLSGSRGAAVDLRPQ